MHNGMLVFDNVVHMFDNRADNLIRPEARDYLKVLRDEVRLPMLPESIREKVPVEVALGELFENSDTDLALAQTVPLFGSWRDGFAPAALQYELKQAAPDRIMFCGGVDPLFMGLQGALDEMERQAEEWGAVSFKFYQAHANGLHWSAEDEEIAYPLFQKALDLGVNHIQFHKGVPLGPENVEYLRPNDLQKAARDFPDLVFVAHHFGDPYVDETVNIAARYPNIWLSLSFMVNYLIVAPWRAYEALGKALVQVGSDRLLWGSEAFGRPIQPFIHALAEAKMPIELQERYGYPEITSDDVANMLGRNYARLLGVEGDRIPPEHFSRRDESR